MPEITLIITTYNKAALLNEALKSVLNQTESIHRIIVLDNCSSDGTEKIVDKVSGVEYIKNSKNIGMINNWNKCFQICKSQFLCILHDDDILDKRWHEKWEKALTRENEDCAFYFSAAGMINNKRRLLSESKLFDSRKYPPGAIYRDLVKARMFSFPVSGTTIYNMSVLTDEDRFFRQWDSKINTYPDIEFHDRIAKKYPVYYLNERLFYSRQQYAPNRSETLGVDTNKAYYKSYIAAVLPFLIRMYADKEFAKENLNKLWLHYYFISVSFAMLYRDKTFISNVFEIKKKSKLDISYLFLPGIWFKDFFKYLHRQIFRVYI